MSKIKYYIGNIEFCECEEGSPMDLAIQAMQKKERAKIQKEIKSLIEKNLPIMIPKNTKSKNILLLVKR